MSNWISRGCIPSALRGFSGLDSTVRDGDMQPLFKTIVEHCPPPDVDADGPLQLQVTLLDYSSYVGAIGIGRITRAGTIKRGIGGHGASTREGKHALREASPRYWASMA